VPSESSGQQQPAGRIPPARGSTLDQGLRRQDPAFDLVRSSQRRGARKICFCQQTLGFVRDPDGVEVNRRSMRLDDDGPPVLQFDAPDNVDAPSTESNPPDRTT
jgi:hypothetical protein